MDGSRIVVSPTHLTPARVTCLIGDGPMEGQALLDDYIETTEQVADYLTKFSGIEPGDLDPTVSTKNLTTLKVLLLAF